MACQAISPMVINLPSVGNDFLKLTILPRKLPTKITVLDRK